MPTQPHDQTIDSTDAATLDTFTNSPNGTMLLVFANITADQKAKLALLASAVLAIH